MQSPYLTAREAAAFLRVSPRTFHRIVAAGKLAVIRPGAGPSARKITVRREVLEAYADAQTGAPATPGPGARSPEPAREAQPLDQDPAGACTGEFN